MIQYKEARNITVYVLYEVTCAGLRFQRQLIVYLRPLLIIYGRKSGIRMYESDLKFNWSISRTDVEGQWQGTGL